MYLLAKYGTQTTFRFPMNIQGATDFAQAADWTPVAGDAKISKDGGAVANSTNLPVIVGGAGGAFWQWTLTATELQAAEIDGQIIDAPTKAVSDQAIIIYTYGNAAAKIVQDLSDGSPDVNVVQVLGTPLVLNGTGGQKIGN